MGRSVRRVGPGVGPSRSPRACRADNKGMKSLHIGAAIAASCAWLLAQAETPPVTQDPPKATPSSDPAKETPSSAKATDEKAQMMRDHMDTGRPLQSHVRVAVRL